MFYKTCDKSTQYVFECDIKEICASKWVSERVNLLCLKRFCKSRPLAAVTKRHRHNSNRASEHRSLARFRASNKDKWMVIVQCTLCTKGTCVRCAFHSLKQQRQQQQQPWYYQFGCVTLATESDKKHHLAEQSTGNLVLILVLQQTKENGIKFYITFFNFLSFPTFIYIFRARVCVRLLCTEKFNFALFLCIEDFLICKLMRMVNESVSQPVYVLMLPPPPTPLLQVTKECNDTQHLKRGSCSATKAPMSPTVFVCRCSSVWVWRYLVWYVGCKHTFAHGNAIHLSHLHFESLK